MDCTNCLQSTKSPPFPLRGRVCQNKSVLLVYNIYIITLCSRYSYTRINRAKDDRWLDDQQHPRHHQDHAQHLSKKAALAHWQHDMYSQSPGFDYLSILCADKKTNIPRQKNEHRQRILNN